MRLRCLVLLLPLGGCPVEMEPVDMAPLIDPQVRFAHYTAGAPNFDICVQGPNDENFVGPLILTKAGVSGGLPYPTASSYFAFSPGAYKLRVVKNTATDCSASLLGLQDQNLSMWNAGRRYTVAAVGYFQNLSTIKLVVVEDDNSPPMTGMARFRFLHAASGEAGLDYGSGSAAGGNFTRLLTAASYGELGTAPGSGSTYLAVAAQTQATYSLRASGASADLQSFMGKVSLRAGSIYTVAAIGIKGNAFSPLSLSVCDDISTPTSGHVNCQEIQ